MTISPDICGHLLYIPFISMADLIKCSTILHNSTISDIMNEITKLKQKMQVYEPQKVNYKNKLEYEELKAAGYKKIREEIFSWARYAIWLDSPEGFGGFGNMHALEEVIKDAMNLLTKQSNKAWVQYISENIHSSLIGFLSAFESARSLSTILGLGESILSNLIYKYIFEHLEAIDQFRLFTCKRCNKIVDYVNDSDICHPCEETDDHLL